MVAKHISAVSYVETTSAYGSAAVTEAFEVAAEAALGLLNKKTTSKKVKTELGIFILNPILILNLILSKFKCSFQKFGNRITNHLLVKSAGFTFQSFRLFLFFTNCTEITRKLTINSFQFPEIIRR